jgi:threonine dehydratase
LDRPSIEDVRGAAGRVASRVHRTPVVTSSALDAELGCAVHFKCENLQKVGAFKARGAVNAVLQLTESAASRGVITHSSGNHGAALAYAASLRGIRCTVVMPDSAPRIKVDAVAGYGAEIVPCKQHERHETCERVRADSGATMIHPFENPDVVAGQGSAALELLQQVPGLDLIVAPVGGGGLLAGTTVVAAAAAPPVEVWGAEPSAVDDAFRSLRDGVRHPGPTAPRSWADGLLTGLGVRAFGILERHDVRIVTVGEGELLRATWTLMRRLKLVVEPSAGTVLAALRRSAAQLHGRKVGAILSGGNTDFRWLGDERLASSASDR